MAQRIRQLRIVLSFGRILPVIGVVVIFAVLGVHELLIGHAATLYTSAEAESGTLTNGASVISDAGASGGQAVKFGSAGSTVSFTVSGNKILNAQGQQVLLHGVDRPSLEWSCSGTDVNGNATGIPASDFTTMRNTWNADAVRIAVSEDRWLPGTKDYCSSYQNTVKAAVQNAENAGLIVIIDLHWSDQGSNTTTSGQQCMPDQNSVTFWQQVASLYKGDQNVWFEMYNEPYPPGANQAAQWSTWQNGGSVTCTATVGGGQGTWNAPGMQTLVNTIRGTGANNIVLAGGLAYSSVLNGVPQLTGGNVAYVIHIYRQNSTWSTSGWDYQFGTTSATVPVVATEFGDQVCDGQAFDQGLLSYFHSHNVGYTAWAWFVSQCNFTSIITDAAGDCAGTSEGCAIQQDMKAQSTSL